MQKINEEHSFISEGVKYERVYVPVNLGIDSKHRSKQYRFYKQNQS